MNCINPDISMLEDKIGYRFNDKQLLITALSHSSYVNEIQTRRQPSYERLEFLGDAVLELISSEYLYDHFPNTKEGELSKMRASLVCEKTLAFDAGKFGLSEFIRLGKGEFIQKGYEKPSVLCDCVESVLGAIYIDGGMEYCREYVFRFILTGEEGQYKDCKTRIQEYFQSVKGQKPQYILVSESGPEHNKKYEMALCHDGKELARGSGSSKKEAEQAAAAAALETIDRR